MKLLTALLLAGALALLGQPLQTPPAKDAPNPAFNPVTDRPGLPRVLLIGDSISIGYTLDVRRRLEGKANVHRIPENGATTVYGLKKIDEWLGDGNWDLIHFNWGLHDLRIEPTGAHQVEIADYEKNLHALVKRMKGTGAKLIWASTTPVPDMPESRLRPPRRNRDVIAYNAAAKRVMEQERVSIDDLYAFALPRLSLLQQPANVHFTEEGSRSLGEQVAMAIEREHRRQ
jgi:acyl-CoA thioesterase-1